MKVLIRGDKRPLRGPWKCESLTDKQFPFYAPGRPCGAVLHYSVLSENKADSGFWPSKKELQEFSCPPTPTLK